MSVPRTIKFEFNLPVLNKFLFCIPLRCGLVICAVIQQLLILFLSWIAVVSFAERTQHVQGYILVELVTLFIFTMVVYLVDSIFCLLLTLGAFKKNVNFLEVCYDYLKVKIWFLIGVVVLEFLLSVTGLDLILFWYRELTPWSALDIDFLIYGITQIAFNVYLLLLVKSYLIQLDHHINSSNSFSDLFTNKVYQQFFTKDLNAGLHDQSDDTKALGLNV